MGSLLHILIAVCFLFVEKAALTPLTCTATCKDGEYCLDTKCLPCRHGTFQTEPIHGYNSCRDWTNKQSEPHYILIKSGTAVSDAKWACKDGYEEKEYTVGGFECVEIVTTSSTVSSSTEPTISTTYTAESTALLPAQQQSNNLSDDAVAGIVVSGVIFVSIIVGVVIKVVCCKRRKGRNILNHTNGDTTQTFVSGGLDSPIEAEPGILNPKNIYYRFCLKFVEELDIFTFKRFLNVLYDPSLQFNAENVLKSELSQNPDVKTYLTKSFLRWVKFNNGIYRLLIVIALDDVGRAHILKPIEKLVPVTYIDVANNDYDESVSLLSNNMERTVAEDAAFKYIRESEATAVLRQDRFRLYYLLTDKIEAGILTRLIRELPSSSDKFNAHNYYAGKLYEERDAKHAFALTIEEWWLQNHGESLKDNIIEFLSDEGREDLLENSKLRTYLQRIVPVDTSSTGIHGQGQCHSSENLASHNTDVGHMSNDSEGAHVTSDSEGGHVVDDSEGGHVTSDSEGGHVVDDSEGGHVTSDSEGGHVTSDSEGGHVVDDSEGGHVTSDSEGGHVVDDSEGGHVTSDSEGGHVADDSEGDYVTSDSEGDHVSNITEGDHVSDDSEGDHVSNNTEGDHVTNSSRGGHVSYNARRDQMSINIEGRRLLAESV